MDSEKNLTLIHKDGFILKVSVLDAINRNMLKGFNPTDHFWGTSHWAAYVTHIVFVQKSDSMLQKMLTIIEREGIDDNEDDFGLADSLKVLFKGNFDGSTVFNFLLKNVPRKVFQLVGF